MAAMFLGFFLGVICPAPAALSFSNVRELSAPVELACKSRKAIQEFSQLTSSHSGARRAIHKSQILIGIARILDYSNHQPLWVH
jgi:hypothetical protein